MPQEQTSVRCGWCGTHAAGMMVVESTATHPRVTIHLPADWAWSGDPTAPQIICRACSQPWSNGKATPIDRVNERQAIADFLTSEARSFSRGCARLPLTAGFVTGLLAGWIDTVRRWGAGPSSEAEGPSLEPFAAETHQTIGAARERTVVVAWLREQGRGAFDPTLTDYVRAAGAIERGYVRAAGAIERGEHSAATPVVATLPPGGLTDVHCEVCGHDACDGTDHPETGCSCHETRGA